jgi:hypothetical protein
MPEATPLIEANIQKLGIKLADITHQSVIKTTFLLYVRSSGAISAG